MAQEYYPGLRVHDNGCFISNKITKKVILYLKIYFVVSKER